jgi:hypothetical protein
MFSSDHFRRIVRLAAIAWMVGVAISLLVGISGITALSLGQIARISAASGFLGLVAILPFSNKAVQRLGGASVAEVLSSEVGLFVAFSIGMGIRIAGTVALFLACRYQMVATDGEIAAFVLAWYLYLTLIEIALVLYQSRRHLISQDNSVKASCGPDAIESCPKA